MEAHDHPFAITQRKHTLLHKLLRGAFDSAKKQAPTPQAPVHNRQTRKVASAKVRMG